MFCKKCGTQLPEGSRFCGACGENLNAEVSAAAAAANASESATSGSNAAEKSKSANALSTKFILFCVAVAVLAVFALTQFHVCDFCDNLFFGPGYDNAEYDVHICNDCARSYHWIGI